MRTNIVIDDDLMARAMRALGTRTKRETVEVALRRSVGAADDGSSIPQRSPQDRMAEARRLFAALPGPSLTVDDFIAERRREEAREEAEARRTVPR